MLVNKENVNAAIAELELLRLSTNPESDKYQEICDELTTHKALLSCIHKEF